MWMSVATAISGASGIWSPWATEAPTYLCIYFITNKKNINNTVHRNKHFNRGQLWIPYWVCSKKARNAYKKSVYSTNRVIRVTVLMHISIYTYSYNFLFFGNPYFARIRIYLSFGFAVISWWKLLVQGILRQ